MSDVTIEHYSFNNDTLATVIVVGPKKASVKDHIVDALSDKFRDYPEILTNLLWVKSVATSRRPMINSPASGQWTKVLSPTRPQGGIRSLKLIVSPTGEPAEYVVRFVGEPFTFYKYFIDGKAEICGDPATCPVRRKHGIEPVQRHVVHLINRADGQLYLVELPASALRPIATWARRRKMNPGGVVAVDFSITVIGRRKATQYEVIPLDASTLTEEEQRMPRYDLERLFRATPESEIESKLFPPPGRSNRAASG